MTRTQADAGTAPARARLVLISLGYVFCLLGFLTMLLLWKEGIPYWKVALAYGLVGIGVGFAGTPASHSLTSSVPVRRVGMASGTSDLQRDLGGAIMQSVLGAVLTAGYVKAIQAAIAASPNQDRITQDVQAELQKSFASATGVAERYPKYETQIVAAAKSSFLSGDKWAYLAGMIAIVIGAALVFFAFPRKDEEGDLLARYEAEDAAPRSSRH